MSEAFHFLQPLWLLALVPLALLLVFAVRERGDANPWRRVVDERLLPLLVGSNSPAARNGGLWLLAAGWCLAVLALANPAWEKQSLPVFQTTAARVIVLDLSRSMLAADVSPSRLERARFKVEDILQQDNEGQTGLVVFAGDAFVVSPLTRDADTIRSLLRALEPDIMPVQGSRADLGLEKAGQLLRQAGLPGGQILLLADGVQGDDATAVAAKLGSQGYRVSVLAAGTPAGAPVPDAQGRQMRDSAGKLQLAPLDEQALRAVAQAGKGRYARMSGSNADIRQLMAMPSGQSLEDAQRSDLAADRWKEKGPLLAALLLPLAALAFRRGWLLAVFLLVGGVSTPQPVMAMSWQDLWQRHDQQAAAAMRAQEYERAARVASDPAQRGSALYRQGDYENALQSFTAASGADADYNRGNALAQLGKYPEAIEAYNQALSQDPSMQDAIANRQAIEDFLEQQKQQQQQQQNGNTEQQGQENQGQDGQAHNSQENDSGQSGGEKQQAPDSDQAGDSGGTDRPGEQSGQNDFADASQALEEQQQPQEDAATADPGASPEPADESAAEAQQAAQSGEDTPSPPANEEPAQPANAMDQAEALNSEEQLAAQQWLRRIPDDPGGLLRRKFLYQYRQQAGQNMNNQSQQW